MKVFEPPCFRVVQITSRVSITPPDSKNFV
jgi:hypothetical protein